jgi:fumiquinazoline A oxidase
VTLATANQIPFLATGGGHGASITLAGCVSGIEIDLSNFNSVSIDADQNTMVVGASTVFEDIIPPLYEAGKEMRTAKTLLSYLPILG